MSPSQAELVEEGVVRLRGEEEAEELEANLQALKEQAKPVTAEPAVPLYR